MVIFCSGIGGIGLSAYASYQRSLGHRVLGSDRSDSPLLRDLQSQGIEVFLTQDGSAVPADTELFVYSEAIPDDSPERKRARALGIPQKSYFQALGDLTNPFKLIAVSGTHGKSSTTAMAARVLIDAQLDPSIIVGTKLHELKERNWRKGGSDLFLAEACEYRRSFHSLSPNIILMTNVDGDHYDYFSSQEDYEEAFVDFAKRLPPGGIIITHLGDPQCARVAQRAGVQAIDADAMPLPELSVPGKHMQQNAQLVLALAEHLKLPREQALSSLSAYRGCWRRMEVRGTFSKDVTVIDDYGHHPSEIRATIEALLGAYAGRRLVVVFQPHTHDRTLKLYSDFTRAFRGAGLVVISNVYDARSDCDNERVNVGSFVSDIEKESGLPAIDGKSLSETERLLREGILRSGDVLLCMGAGDITALAGRMSE